MKKLIYLLLLFAFYGNAQTVNIPDANFKAKLISLGVDTNTDGEIQETEALVVATLDVSNSSISDLTGIESFLSLTNLNCYQNSLTTLNLNALTNLTDLNLSSNLISTLNINSLVNLSNLNVYGNSLTTFDFSSLTNLTFLNCGGNNFLTSINVNGLVNLQELSCSGCGLNSLNVSGLVNLTKLTCDQNSISSLDVHDLVNLQLLSCHTNQLSSLELTGLTQLTELYCAQNQIAVLDLTGLVNINYIWCYDNLLTSLDVSFMSGLIELNCDSNQLTSLNVSGLNNLTSLTCYDNQLTTLNLDNLPSLVTIICENNLLTTLDVSSSPSILSVLCSNNLLETLFIKNGSNESGITFSNNPNLAYICADDSQIAAIQGQLNSLGMNSTVCNSYCSFVPGGNYNTIHGVVTFDSDGNGCDTNDNIQPNIKISINDGTNQGATFTNSIGNYNFYAQSGNFTLTPSIENISWFAISPNFVTVPFADSNNNVVVQNFCLLPSGLHPDVEIAIAPIAPARPGFDAIYQIVYKNKGNQILSGIISFAFNDEVLDYIASTILPDIQNNGVLSWNYQNLLPFENRSIYVTLNVNSPQEIPAVNINDILSFQAINIPVNGDEITDDNFFSYDQIVVGSFDPNDITCIEGEIVPPSEIGEYLHYIINFENTGTAEAENIVVKVEVDTTKFDIDSLQLLNTSHNAYTRQKDNTIEFIFQEVWLDTGGHGNVLLKIKSKNNLQEGDAVAKRANIYFDYNMPIETNIANTTYEILSNGNFEMDESIIIFPNPTSSMLNINCNNTIKTVELYDVQGRLLQTQIVDSATTILDVSEKQSGIYFAKVTSENGVKVQKISKE